MDYSHRDCDFHLADIKKMETVSIRPVLDFGGWGIRFSHKGKGYIIGGSKVVKVIFKTGRPVYFSTEEPERVVDRLRSLKFEEERINNVDSER